MQANSFRARIERGEVQIGSWVNIVHNPAILTLMKATGLDFARIDMEHSRPSSEVISSFALLSRALDFPIAVRPPSPSKEWIQRLLDAGVWNLHIAGVETVEQAAEVASASRYYPKGTRGMALQGPNTDFDLSMSVNERTAFANQQVFVTVMIETPAALDRIDEIASMEGIDALTVGPNDLAQNLGIYGTADQAKIINEKRDLMIAAAKKHGKAISMLVGNDEEAKRWAKAGALILAYKSDVNFLYEGFSQIAKLKKALI